MKYVVTLLDTDPGLLTIENAILSQKLDETQKRLFYVLADLENLRKREEMEAENRALALEAKAFLPLLTVVDDLERVWEQAPQGAFKDGLKMVLDEFKAALKKAEIEEVPGVGSPFDPMLHEAVGDEEADLPPSTVAVELRKGYTLRGKLLRPSIVKVSKPRAESNPVEQK